MPIVNVKPNSTPNTGSAPANLPTTKPEEYQNVIVEDNTTPLTSLLGYIEGAPWIVIYYSQLVNKNNDLKVIDSGLTSIQQPYSKIIGFEFRVSQDLQSQTDPDSKITTLTGAALIYPVIVPNEGDVFIASIPGGFEGLFNISNVNRKTYNLDSVYEIEYVLIERLDRDSPMYKDAEAKVLRTYYYHKERLVDGVNPNVTTTEHEDILQLTDTYRTMVKYYFKTFFNHQFKTLIIPGQSFNAYDHYVVSYISKIVDGFDAPEAAYVKILPTEGDSFMAETQFWDVMLSRNIEELDYCNKEMGLADTIQFNLVPSFKGLRYCGLSYIVYPKAPDDTVFGEKVEMKKITDTVSLAKTKAHKSITGNLDNTYTTVNGAINIIDGVLDTPTYVFSDDFYTRTGTTLSLLESLTLDYLKGNPINISQLAVVCSKYMKWERLDQFYLIPILITLIKATVKGI